MAKQIPRGLIEKQNKQKGVTIKKIEEAIKIFQDLGYGTITIANLVSETGLSRSTFNKSHVQEVLKKHNIGKYRDVKTLVIEQENKYNRENIQLLEQQLKNSATKINKLESELKTTKSKLKQEQMKSIALDLKNRELADKFQRMYDKVVALGVEIIL